MTDDSPTLSPELLARVRQALREGESLAGFVEAAVRQHLARRSAAVLPSPAPDPVVPADGGHDADELLARLDAWLKAPQPRADAAALNTASCDSPAR